MTRVRIIVVVALMVCVLAAVAFGENVGFVSRAGNQFVVNGHPFYYAGCNNYYQMVYGADLGLRYAVDEVQEEMAAMGMTVLRTWAFNDGAGQWNALQISPGVYQEYVFQGLDYVLYKADQEGLRVILTLVNNWDDYGGMNQYVAWADSVFPGNVGFVQVDGMRFEVDGRPYYYAGVNYWYGMNLGSNGPGGDRARLVRELDWLRGMGVTNLRVTAGSEGPNSEPWRMVPALQTEPGVYDSLVLDGLDYLVGAMKDRGLRAVMCLTNFWQWSGGMAQYVSWNGGGPIPYPPPEPGGNWNTYQDYASDFYSNPGAMEDYRDHVAFLINHVNPYTGLAYRDEATIMAWELANEPRGFHNNAASFNTWIDSTAAYIKGLDPNHLVTTGCEGDTPWPSWNGLDFVQNHNGCHIDYATIHIWPQNWGWYDPANPGGTYATAEASARAYFNDHEAEATVLGKPMVLEEFGLARDSGSFDPCSATTWRDLFLGAMYQEVYSSASLNGPVAGDDVWAWAGEGRPLVPYGSYWNPGDPWIGDPPHEQQGWYSVYDSDTSTVNVIFTHAAQMRDLTPSSIHDDFFTDELCRQFYRDHVGAVLRRINTFNGRDYKDDQTVFAWELANEPRCETDPSGDSLQAWIEEMSTYIKNLDTLHMVTTGSEGFYGASGPAHNPSGWMGTRGVDFVRNHQTETIDFACYHLWPDWWGMSYNTSVNWVTNHTQDADAYLGKPVILEEYGKQQPISLRDQYFQGWLGAIYNGASANASSAGSNLWILYHDDYPDYDGFGVYYPADSSTVLILEGHAENMNQLTVSSMPEIQDVTISVTGDDVTLCWSEVPGASCYLVYRSSQPRFQVSGMVPFDSTNGTEWLDESATSEDHNFYRITFEYP
jgi:mannan endo-1,4-beta-mannosidase